GVVVGVLASGEGHDLPLKLVESDQRKATFLRTCARELDVSIEVSTQRVESLPPNSASTISARALASLDVLLGLAKPHLAEAGTCVFMKGEAWAQELEAAQQNWRFSCDATPSKTNEKAAILRIKDIERV
ncbi:MAG: RsmG family class I SAM-dependent methyltransferase, partial [Rhizobiaceae bacterium]